MFRPIMLSESISPAVRAGFAHSAPPRSYVDTNRPCVERDIGHTVHMRHRCRICRVSGRNVVPFRPETGDRSQVEGIAQEVALQRQQVLRDDRVIGHMRDSGQRQEGVRTAGGH